jgi:hypothetical protein
MKSNLASWLLGSATIMFICLSNVFYASADTNLDVSVKSTSCEPGYYRDSKSCIEAKIGRYSPNGTKQIGCPIGHICPSRGMSKATPCEPGTYYPHKKGKICSSSYPGYYVPARGSANRLTCPAGSYCPNTNNVTPIKCQVGHFAPEGREKCVVAPEGFYAPTTGLVNAIPCPSGHACPGIKTSAPRECGVGTYSKEQAEACTECPRNNMQDKPGQGGCGGCSTGYGGSNYLGKYVAGRYVASGAAACLYQCNQNDATRADCYN